MEKYESIQEYIDRAQVQRSALLAEMICDAGIATWHGVRHAADVLLAAARAKTRNNVFTFDS